MIAGDKVRGGNHLYQWMLAHSRRRENPQTYVRTTENQAAWLEEFPHLRELAVRPHDMHVTDRRSLALGQAFGSDFTRDELTDFCTTRLLASTSFSRRLTHLRETVSERIVTVNVRRGDYYGTPFEPEFGMRITPFVIQALNVLSRREAVDTVQLVSDDLGWCRASLAPALIARGVDVRATRPGKDMFDDLAALAVSRRLVLANSTFSYWGAYLATVLGTRPEDVVCPFFHQRALSSGRPRFHDPQWSVVQRIEGGWQSATPS